MRLVIQRVKSASVFIENKITAHISNGLLVFLGIRDDDTVLLIPRLAKKIAELRIFEDDAGKMNLSVQDIRGEVLIVSQFTLYADCRRGRRPDFIRAAKPPLAEELYNEFIRSVREYNLTVSSGVFAAYMDIALVNDGPVTIILDSDNG